MTTVLFTDADYLRRWAERCETLAAITVDERRRETLLSPCCTDRRCGRTEPCR